MMTCLRHHILIGLIIFINHVRAEMTIEVNKDNCGGSLNIDDIWVLHLNYYGAKLGTGTSRRANSCLFNISSYNSNPALEICILNYDYESWDIACGSSLKIYIGTYPFFDFPSMHHCTSFRPLCTSEKKVFFQYMYDRALHIMKKDINIKFDIYLRKKLETTTKLVLTTGSPSVSSSGRGKAGFSIIWIILIIIGGVLAFIFCTAFWFYCCCYNENEEQTQSQDNQNVEMNEGRRRMLEGPVVHVPPENLNCTSTEPPDYYTVCSGDSQYPGDDSSYREEKDNPNTPLQPSAPPPDESRESPPPYPGFR